MSENRDEKEWFRVKAQLEIPPPGYSGSLKGTGWDPEVMLSEYENNG